MAKQDKNLKIFAVAVCFAVCSLKAVYAQNLPELDQSNSRADSETNARVMLEADDYSRSCLRLGQGCIGIALTIGRDKLPSIARARERVVDNLAQQQGLDPMAVDYSHLDDPTKSQVDQVAYFAAMPEVYEELVQAFGVHNVTTRIYAGETTTHRNSGVVFLVGGVPYEDADGVSAFTISDRFANEQVDDVLIALSATRQLCQAQEEICN